MENIYNFKLFLESKMIDNILDKISDKVGDVSYRDAILGDVILSCDKNIINNALAKMFIEKYSVDKNIKY
jgi:hypothetical protein